MINNENVLNEVEFYKKFNAILEECTSLIIQSNEQNFHERLDDVLEQIGCFSGVDRAYFFECDSTKRSCSNLNEWCRQGVSPQIENLQNISYDLVPEWMKAINNGQMIYINDLKDLKPEWFREQALLEEQDIKSLLSLPVRESEILYGFIGFDAVADKIEWKSDVIRLLGILANTIGSVIRRNLQNRELGIKIEELTKLHQQNKTFISVINHDVFAPIKHINIVGNRLLKHVEDLDKQELIEHITMMFSSTQRMELLCSNILHILRNDEGLDFYPEITPGCMFQALEDLQNYISVGLSVNNNVLKSEVKGSSGLFINRNVLNTILTNLINNANRFTKNGTIQILCNFEQPLKRISVVDTGKGMSDAVLNKLRSRNIVIGNRDNPELSGYGIGYSLIFKMLDMVNGHIDIQSEPNEGTTVTFSWLEPE